MTVDRAALYARVSKSDESQNPENQLRRLRRWANDRGYEYEEYIDMVSGAKADRPALSDLLDRCRSGEFNAVVAVRIDRFGRSLIQLEKDAESLRTWGVRLVFLDQAIDTATPIGRLLFQFLAAFAEFERELIRERTIDGMARARAKGNVPGRPRVACDAEEVYRLRTDHGMTWNEIADRFGVSSTTARNRYTEALEDLQKRGGDQEADIGEEIGVEGSGQ